MRPRAIASVLFAALPAGCLPPAVPPPPVPERLLPPVEAAAPPPAPGQGQVTIVADEPSLVEEITGHFEGVGGDGLAVDGLTYRTVCPATPCIASLELGPRDLRLTSLVDADHGGTGTILVGEQPSAYRYALGHDVPPSVGRQVGGAFALTYGGLGVIAGGILIGIGQTSDTDAFGNSKPGTNFRPWGYGTAVISAALIAYGIHLLRHSAGSTQDGAGVQWTP